MATVTFTRDGEIAKNQKVNADPVKDCLNKLATGVNNIDSSNITAGSITTACLNDDSVTAAKIADGTITDTHIASGADITSTKVALAQGKVLVGNSDGHAAETSVTSGQIIVGDSSGYAAAVTPTGDVTISNAGVTAIASGVIVNADVNASAAIATTKMAFTAVSGTAAAAGSLWGFAWTTVPTSITATVGAWTTFDCDYANGASGTASNLGTIPAGNILILLSVRPGPGHYVYVRPNGRTAWTTAESATPRCYGNSTYDEHLMIVATDSSHVFQYYSDASAGETKITLLGYLAGIPA